MSGMEDTLQFNMMPPQKQIEALRNDLMVARSLLMNLQQQLSHFKSMYYSQSVQTVMNLVASLPEEEALKVVADIEKVAKGEHEEQKEARKQEAKSKLELATR